jgi:hypothetical protein
VRTPTRRRLASGSTCRTRHPTRGRGHGRTHLTEATVPASSAPSPAPPRSSGVSERWRSEGLGPFRHRLADAAPGTLVIRRGLRPGLLAPPTFGTRFAWSAAR